MTQDVSSMILSARFATVLSEAITISLEICFVLKSGNRPMYIQTCVKIVITTVSGCGSADWINMDVCTISFIISTGFSFQSDIGITLRLEHISICLKCCKTHDLLRKSKLQPKTCLRGKRMWSIASILQGPLCLGIQRWHARRCHLHRYWLCLPYPDHAHMQVTLNLSLPYQLFVLSCGFFSLLMRCKIYSYGNFMVQMMLSLC